jgi:uncharacterized protein (TIGR02118 family)
VTLVRVGMAPRASGLSYEEAQHHWRTEHRDVALELEGLRGYVQNHAVLRDGRPLLAYPGFDVCAETQFDDLDAMRAAFASEHYRRTVRADEAKLIDGTRFLLALTYRRVLGDGEPPDDAVKLMTFLRECPSGEGLDAVLAGEYAEAAAAARPLRHEQLIVDHFVHEGEQPACCDAIDLLWFRDADEALAAIVGPLSERAGWALAGRAFGAERALVRPLRMR